MSARSSRTLLASAIAMASATSFNAYANDPIALNDVVVSASGFEQKITEAPASISVISREDLQQKRYNSLAHALSDVEGIDVGQGTGKTGGLNISIRGMPSAYTLILIDGRRQNAAGNITPNGFGETSTSFIPPMSSIERIEVIRGPMSTLYGSDAMGGVINIITRKVAKEWTGSISQDYTYQEHREYGDTHATNFYTSGPLVDGLLGAQVRGNYFNRDESSLQTSQGTDLSRRGLSPVEGDRYSIGGRLTLTPDEDNDISLDVERSRQSYNNDECQLGTLDGWTSGSATSGCSKVDETVASGYADKLRFERDQYTLSHTGRFDFGTLESSLMRNTSETLGRTIPGGTPTITVKGKVEPNPDFKPIGQSYSGYPSIIVGDDRKLKTTNTVFDSKLVTALGDANITSVGVQWWHAKMTDGLASEKFEQTTKALFAENEWRMRDDLALTLGGRWDHHETFGNNFSPRAYLVWNTNDSWTLKGGVSKGFKAPDLNDLHSGINGVTNQGASLTIGNPNLKPETSTSTEIGAYYDNLSGFTANATLFHNKFKDKIATIEDVLVENRAGVPTGLYDQKINLDEAVTQGLELGASWNFAHAWTLSGNYTYTDSEQKSGDDKGAPLTTTPKHIANAKLKWQTTDRLGLWLASEYRGERARFNSKPENLTGVSKQIVDTMGRNTKAYNLLHFGGSYQATENLQLNATIYNLLDKDFTKGRAFNGTGAYATDYASNNGQSSGGTIEERRRLWVSATLEF